MGLMNGKPMDRRKSLRLAATALAAVLATLIAGQAHAVRIKDVTHILGVRENQLMGYGLVVGLSGTGDGTSATFTTQSLANYLRRNNISVDPGSLRIENVAAVIITANMAPFARKGTRMDVLVNSIGDAESLQGGTLLMTPLYSGQPGVAYAVAQGPISIGGFGAASAGAGVTKNHLTAGKIPGGAIVEIDSPVSFENREEFHLILSAPDFTTAQRIVEVIDFNIGPGTAKALNAAEVRVSVPLEYRTRLTEFLARIERLPVHPDQRARIVIVERTGTIVMGENVRISTLALAHGNLTIQITKDRQVSQPGPFSLGVTTEFTDTGVSVQEEFDDLKIVEEGVSLGEVVRSLNAIGVTPRDLIAILQSIKSLGALQAELVIQ